MIRPTKHRAPQSIYTRRAHADEKARTAQTAWPIRSAWKCATSKPRKQPRPARLAAAAAS